MERIARFVAENRTVRLVLSVVGFDGVRKCLVGGAVRDLLADRPVVDLDFLFGPKGQFLVREIGRKVGRKPARLENKDDETWRILLPEGDTCDFTILGSSGGREPGTPSDPAGAVTDASVDDNLRARDFTVNAMAADLESGALIDPTGGRGDLAARLLRVAAAGAFAADPLRILRAARFLATLPGFAVEKATAALAAAGSPGLAGVAGERVREESFKILRGERLEPALAFLDASGAALALFGDGRPALRPADRRALVKLRDRMAEPLGGEPPDPDAVTVGLLAAWQTAPILAAAVAAGRRPDLKAWAARLERLRFSNREIALFLRLVEGAADVAAALREEGGLAEWRAADIVNRLRFDAGVLAALLDHVATLAASKPLAAAAVRLAGTLERGIGLQLPRLVDGEDLKSMGLAEGPAVGRILGRLRRAQLEGRVASRREAHAFVIELLDEERARHA